MTRIRKEEATPLLSCDGQGGRIWLLPGIVYRLAQLHSVQDYTGYRREKRRGRMYRWEQESCEVGWYRFLRVVQGSIPVVVVCVESAILWRNYDEVLV